MTAVFHVYAIPTGIIGIGDDIGAMILQAVVRHVPNGLQEGDIIIVAESPVATSEGRVVRLDTVHPGDEAREMGEKYALDPRVAQLVLDESEKVVGGIPGFLLALTRGTLLPNAGIDASNAPPGSVVLLPADPDRSALSIRQYLADAAGKQTGVIIADSRTHAMRIGCSGVAIGVAGIPAIIDDRGRTDLFGNVLHVTRRAVADNLASAAELVMGEADECIPAALIRGMDLQTGPFYGIESMLPEECLFMGLLKRF
jgi:coenzyme F420-0:L-glutamate ligase / coenzyme F420-1:gamma-L-glutamate ligase